MRGRLALTGALCLVLLVAGAAPAEVIQRGSVRVVLDGAIAPKRLPRDGGAPVKVTVGTRISAAADAAAPRLRRIEIAINRHGRIDPSGLPLCEVDDIQPATTAKALQACRGALVGHGRFLAQVAVSRQSAFPSEGRIVAFNGTYRGRPAILAHVYGSDPLPTSLTLPFVLGKASGIFGTKLTATLPYSDDGYVTGIELILDRVFTYRGERRGYASASCPAPKGFPGAVFPFAKATYSFVGGPTLSSTLVRSCKARG